jgi:hypothetical protein
MSSGEVIPTPGDEEEILGHILVGGNGERQVIFTPKNGILSWERIKELSLSMPISHGGYVTPEYFQKELELSTEELEDRQIDGRDTN